MYANGQEKIEKNPDEKSVQDSITFQIFGLSA